MAAQKDVLKLGGKEFTSRFILGSGKYSMELIEAAVEHAGAQMVTLAVRRTNTKQKENILDYIPKGVTLLPNTSGARDAKEAVRIARMSRELGCGDFVKVEIMKDSRIGTNGALALLFDIVLKIVFLIELSKSDAYLAVLLAPVAGKMATPILIKSNYAREQKGLGSLYLSQKYTKYMIVAVLIGIALIGGFLQIKSILPILSVLLFAFLFREYCQHKIGGMTGDTLGAGYELSEIIFLLVMTLQGVMI